MIRKGEVWGRPVDLDGTEPEASSDAEVARLMSRPLDSPVVLRGGDLYHSLGGRASSPVDLDGPVMALPIDLVAVRVDGVDRVAAAHVVARRRWWSGEFAVAMNGTHLGEWNLGPKAHPNDGLIDVTTGRLDVRDRWEARRRAHTGTHLPHPALSTSRVTSTVWTFDRLTPVYVDGVAVGSARRVELEVQPDRGSVVVG